MDPFNVSSLIEIDTSKMNPQLRFQEYPDRSADTVTQTERRNSAYDGVEILAEESNKKSVWSFKFYQQFFDVNTEDVVNRIKWSMIPRRGVNYLEEYIQTKPDLYGPFWVSVTLVFTIAISGNLANYLQTAVSHHYHWKYDFHIVSFAATAIFTYAWILPCILWSYLKWNGTSDMKLSLLELICVYGYCISVYIPVSILWVIQVHWLQWMLVLVAAISSGGVLVLSMFSLFGSQKFSLSIIISILHIILAISFMLYFFHIPAIDPISVSDKTSANLISVSDKTLANNSH